MHEKKRKRKKQEGFRKLLQWERKPACHYAYNPEILNLV